MKEVNRSRFDFGQPEALDNFIATKEDQDGDNAGARYAGDAGLAISAMSVMLVVVNR